MFINFLIGTVIVGVSQVDDRPYERFQAFPNPLATFLEMT